MLLYESERRADLTDFDIESLERIARVKSLFPELILSSINVQEEYGLPRSFRRGSNSETLNRGVSKVVIDRNNRWRKVKKAGARKAKILTRNHYTEVLVSLKRYLEYYQAL